MAEIVLGNLRKDFDGTPIVRGIDLRIADGEFLVLVGPSGCGKTTTLRMIAGLESVSSGEIIVDGRVVNGVTPRERDVAMVFQNYALFPHMTVRENMSFGLRLRGASRGEIERRVSEAADILNIHELLDRRPKQLSGGQRQRVAMGRAIVRDPKVFLFDEPLSNLDAKLRVVMRSEIKKLHQRLGATMVYVTHDQVEAMTLADRIVVMNDGRIEQVGTPQSLYERPQTRFVAGFIGSPSMNFINARLERGGGGSSIRLGVDLKLPLDDGVAEGVEPWIDQDLVVGIRPEHITERRPHVVPSQVDFEATVEFVEPMGNDTMVHFRIDRADVCARANPRAVRPVGEPMVFSMDMSLVHFIDPRTDKVLRIAGDSLEPAVASEFH
jgi:multiple sugar transport system ATP-binding protein